MSTTVAVLVKNLTLPRQLGLLCPLTQVYLGQGLADALRVGCILACTSLTR